MSMQFSPEDIARIRDDVRLLIRHADVHEESLEGLVRATDTEVRDAEAALSSHTQRRDDRGRVANGVRGPVEPQLGERRCGEAGLCQRSAATSHRPATARPAGRSVRGGADLDRSPRGARRR